METPLALLFGRFGFEKCVPHTTRGRYYTVYDRDRLQVGFAVAKHSGKHDAHLLVDLSGKPEAPKPLLRGERK